MDRFSKKIIRVFFCVAIIGCCWKNVFGFKLLHENSDPAKVIKLFPMSESPWRSKPMRYPGKFNINKIRVWTDEDFFISEFGIPCDFSLPGTEKIKKHMRFSDKGKYAFKNGMLNLKTGKKGFWFAFGPEPNTYGSPSLRLGCKWGRHMKDRYRLRMTLQQNVKNSEWEISLISFFRSGIYPVKFKIRGTGLQTIEADAGYVRNIFSIRRGICGFRIKCLTPGIEVKIKRIFIAPYSAKVWFRKTFTLGKLPVIAHATYESPVTYKLYVNGKLADKGRDVYPPGTVKTLNLLPYLKKGRNTIAVEKEFFTWIGGKPEFIFEGICVDKEGEITRILCPDGWKSSLTYTKGWEKPGFDDSEWKNAVSDPKGLFHVITTRGSNGKVFWTGVEPKHMGMLQAEPADRKYPVWDTGETVRYKVYLPVGVKDKYFPELSIYKAETDCKIKASVSIGRKETPGLIYYQYSVNKIPAGPYRIEFKLKNKSGDVLEVNRQELIIAGSVKQDTLGFSEFEKKFEKRLKKVIEIDCSKKAPADGEFCDHSGMYSPARYGVGKVVEADKMKYRETGSGCWDWFAYRLHGLTLGKPYLAEIVIPDNRPRYIHTGVIEQWPVGFNCNYSSGDWPNATATGACITGVSQPLSMQYRKIRFVFWPASKCSALFVMSGFRGFPAAASKIRIYKINKGLPALRLPETNRMFGSHNERISVMTLTTGISEDPLMGDPSHRRNGHRDVWLHWYRAIERKIRWLRFQGRNMTVEGVYMYDHGDYPSLKHNRYISNTEIDPILLAIKMYNANKIHCMLGVEFISSPLIWTNEKLQISDRKMWEGASTPYQVDKYGRQVIKQREGGVNFLHPAGKKILLDCISEIYNFYKHAGKVDGLFLVTGYWWMPSFITGSYKDIYLTDVGYGDYTVSLFEKETGVKLKNIPSAGYLRFMKRYELLMGKHQGLWLYWRANKIKEILEEIERIISGDTAKWPLYVYRTIHHKRELFDDKSVLRSDRDSYLQRIYTEAGIPCSLYEKSDNGVNLIMRVPVWGKFHSPLAKWRYRPGIANNTGTVNILRKFRAFYFAISGLDEVDLPAKAAPGWIWSITGRAVFLPRWAEEYALAEYVNVVSKALPEIIFYSWLDCNMVTDNGPAIRRFSRSFLLIPDIKFTPLSSQNVKGVVALAGKKDNITWLRLINTSPYVSKGYFKVYAEKVNDMLYDEKPLSPSFLSGGKYFISLKPYDMRLFKLKNAEGKISCEFHLPEKVESEIFAKIRYILNDNACLKRIPGDYVAKLFRKLADKDAFGLYCLLNDFEVSRAVANAEAQRNAILNQEKLIQSLNKDKARIICGTENKWRAPDGSVWLPDQAYIIPEAYGHTGAHFADRGNIEIKNTELDRVYQTETYGSKVIYKIPVPPGSYNVYLHFAETYIKIQSPDIRKFRVRINNRLYPHEIDPFKLAGGWGTAYILKIKHIPAFKGLITIELTGGVGINGIEIEKSK